ncbi:MULTISPECIES: hypothetical protein [unclassified Imperialibacter]|uniref:hypothetical protein n=1 Tax=unclassified Imperialibacter TaxID=2629706 RepID=UPI001256D405|nr:MULTISPECIES: hypothetical protein [unclassified Imperialibacter]CAD5280737.1 conserved hypothetical protein [Imperialibacter sp. 75]CAD5284394.1 conserved hypothetical protein [Imperialibacter sp. 89]VVT28403.1 conserved hypothetical protein [Imperialibacter sp. EC-SDR9]
MNSTVTNEVLVFKTNIRYKKDVSKIMPLLESDNRVMEWNVDQMDVDNVLRIASGGLHPTEVITMIQTAGYFCEELPD